MCSIDGCEAEVSCVRQYILLCLIIINERVKELRMFGNSGKLVLPKIAMHHEVQKLNSFSPSAR
jgi:hypothetical protein